MVIIGSVSMVSLPVSQFPNIVPPEIRIQTTYVGADAQTRWPNPWPRPSRSR